MKTLTIPNGCVEYVFEGNDIKPNHFKIARENALKAPKKGEQVQFYMEGSGYSYNGEIYHKTKDYIYIYIY